MSAVEWFTYPGFISDTRNLLYNASLAPRHSLTESLAAHDNIQTLECVYVRYTVMES